MEVALKASYQELMKSLIDMGLSPYHVSAYVSLLNLNRSARAEEIQRESSKFHKIPPTKIHYILKQLEEKYGLVSKSGYPYEFSAKHPSIPLTKLYEEQTSLLKARREQLEEKRNRILSTYSKIIGECEAIWEITHDDAKILTRDLWRMAEDSIILMTEVGGWVMNDNELISILESKRFENPKFKMYAMISRPDILPEERKRVHDKFKAFLEKLQAKIYESKPGTFRMNIVDKKRCLLWLTPSEEAPPEEQKVYYAPSKVVSTSLAELFFLKWLFEGNDKQKVKKILPEIEEELRHELQELYFKTE